MDILELMKADHDEVAEIIDELESLAETEDPDEISHARSLVTQVGRLLLLHAKSEEVALYEACKDKTRKVRDFALQGYQEHELITRMIEKLSTRTPGLDGDFLAVLLVAKELFDHHARIEEEKQAFPKLRRAFTGQVREQMAQRMLDEKTRLLETISGAEPEAGHAAT